MSQLQSMTIEELFDEFDALADWEERCDYLIDLGFDLPKMPDTEKTEQNRVHGCQSNVWMVARVNRQSDPPIIEFLADSDAMIVRGLIAVLLTVYSGRTADEILETDIEQVFSRLGLNRQLSPARRNGLYGMVKRIETIARETASATT